MTISGIVHLTAVVTRFWHPVLDYGSMGAHHINHTSVAHGLCTPGVLCSIGYPAETHLKPKSRDISLAHNLFTSSWIVLNFCTEHGSDTERTWKIAAIFSRQIYILYYLLTTFMDYTWRFYNLWYGRYFIRYVKTLLVTFECIILYYRPPLNALFIRLSSALSGCSVSTRSQGIPTPELVPKAPVLHGWLLAALLNNAWQYALRAIGPGADGIP